MTETAASELTSAMAVPEGQRGPWIEQAGAICYRQSISDDAVEVLLVGSCRSGKWGIPKGHVELGETTHAAAAREAFEEAGVTGVVRTDAIGSYSYLKDDSSCNYHVCLHLIAVNKTASDFPERHVRAVRWVPASAAADEVVQPELRAILRGLFA
jgi:8-oxo-dGTP pyrophosphatase MutT (NUDIX family)